MLLLCQTILIVSQLREDHYSPSTVLNMSIHSWTILTSTFVKVIHVTGTIINREPILGKLFGRSPNSIFGCPDSTGKILNPVRKVEILELAEKAPFNVRFQARTQGIESVKWIVVFSDSLM